MPTPIQSTQFLSTGYMQQSMTLYNVNTMYNKGETAYIFALNWLFVIFTQFPFRNFEVKYYSENVQSFMQNDEW